LTWVEKITTAMPAVKPQVTGKGMNLITPPIRARPSPTRAAPAIMVATISPSSPCWLTMPATMITKAPVGPPICTREPPIAEMIRPAMMAV
jgi:hypothetical protein